MIEHLFSLAIVKGLVEANDAQRYFGSLLGFTWHFKEVVSLGWVGEHGDLTDLGREIYESRRLGDLPREGRAYMWNWKKVENG